MALQRFGDALGHDHEVVAVEVLTIAEADRRLDSPA
jgi:hypothetical protein